MTAAKTSAKKGAQLDLAGGKYSVISLGVGTEFLLSTAAAMKVLELMRSAVPVHRNFRSGKGGGNHYTSTSLIGRLDLTIMAKGDTVMPGTDGDGDADQA